MSSSYHPQTDGQTEVLNLSPFEAVYGVPPPTMLSYVPGTTKVQVVDDYLRTRTEILQDLRQNLTVARDRMKSRADQNRREVTFDVGDYVYLKLQPLLKKQVGPLPATAPILPPVSNVPSLLQPEAILDRRVTQKGKFRPKTEILVKWVGAPREDATWENAWRFSKSYPDFILEDKDTPSGEECVV
ncbi:hypothetical protein ACOSP7_013854 [Xanthoceras sorbifolium]